MMRKFAVVLCVLLLCSVVVFGQSQPSAKATAKVADLAFVCSSQGTNGCPEGSTNEAVILRQKIKTPNQKDLFVNVSLECGLRTDTQVESAKGSKTTAISKADVVVSVLVDDEEVSVFPVHPSQPVNFCSRRQELSATFDGLLTTCLIPEPACAAACATAEDPDACIAACPLVVDPLCLQTLPPEQVGLILDTVEASAFNFIIPDVPAGVHEVVIKAKVGTMTDLLGDNLYESSASAKGFLGWGSVTIESVRMIKGEDVVDVP